MTAKKDKDDKKAEIEALKLTPKQLLFCRLYASDREFFGNGVQSYIEAYHIDPAAPGAYKTAMVNASKMLRNAKVLKCVHLLFEAHGLNDVFVDKQLEKLIIQDADFKTKLGAIKEYNAMRDRIKHHVNVTSDNNPLSDLTTDELRKLIGG